ncbi:serine--tRNA ligase, mitochondrial isoform X2 [Agrilus planipennis]|nr:serine--tRNA ligase, mitochondrial isoform X2 [Agrilus planipennis]XP_025836114.1 serine--tRNA ligase, mitochondrial isoform X2 [Agrilus planipennis]
MSLAGFLMNKTFSRRELPTKLAAVSRCYRAETSSTSEERGIYRVHEFTKVEMFVISTPESSEDHLEELITIEQDLFGDMGLYLRVLDMPPHELGAPAYRKYDIEAWLPGRKIFGEISSCSNCTDYQSRRLNIKYSSDNDLRYVHTLNGTACAIPRMLIALTETYQTEKGSIEVPNVLQKYMNNKMAIGRQKTIPELKLVKNKKEK